jgi:sulfur relay (sulfurtransferase) DsrC/TusE family protein
MAKKKKAPLLNIPDFFGTYNTYRIFGLKSELSSFPFANQLGQTLHTTFTILTDFERCSNQFAAQFNIFYAEYSQNESIHCLLLENKALISNQKEIFVSKAEKKLSFQTLSLFDEYLYLFNNQEPRCFELSLGDMDYLLLLFAKKDVEMDIFSHFSRNLTPFKAQNITFLLEKQQTSAQEKIVTFLRDFYCKYEVRANQSSRKRKMDLLSSTQQLPNQNLQFPIPIRLENEMAADNLQLREEYLALLAGE